jgi:O-antigen/teichoic acid export membrane protein
VSLFREQIVAIRIPILEASLIHPSYWAGLDIVPYLLLAYWFHGWYINFSSGIFIKEKTRVLYKITLLGALVTVVANVALIPLFGMTGSAVATLCSYGVMALTLGRISRNVLRVEYRLLRSLGLMMFAAIMVFGADIAGTWFATSEAWGEMIGIWLYAGIMILVAGASWVYLRPLRN